jgi:hypothetical protein
MRIKSLRPLLAGLFLAAALPAQAAQSNFYNGVWYNDMLGYLLTQQNGDQIVGTVLLPNRTYMVFFGDLSSHDQLPCDQDKCYRIMGNATQLFTSSEVKVEIDFGVESTTPPTTAIIKVIACNAGAGEYCVLPTGATLPFQKIF